MGTGRISSQSYWKNHDKVRKYQAPFSSSTIHDSQPRPMESCQGTAILNGLVPFSPFGLALTSLERAMLQGLDRTMMRGTDSL